MADSTLVPAVAGRDRPAVRLAPLIVFEAYLTATLLLFAFGPIEHGIADPMPMYAYAVLGQLLIAVGYLAGCLEPGRGYRGPLPAKWVWRAAIVISLAVLAPSLIYRNYGELSLLEALANPGVAYQAKQSSIRFREALPLVSVWRAAMAPVIGLFIPAGVVYWRKLVPLWRALWLLGVACWLGESLITGTSKGLFDLVLTLPWLIWLARRGAPDRSRPVAPTFKRGLRVALAASVLLALAITAFSHFTESRAQLPGATGRGEAIGWSVDRYGVALPEGVERTSYMLSRYLTLGYQGLAGCLDLPFRWCYGVGHSRVLSRYGGVLLGDPDRILGCGYPARLDQATGYSEQFFWHTIYPWLASDLTFTGALLFMGLMAFLLARVWADSIVGKNPFAFAFLVQLLLLFFYVPAQNVRLMFSEEVVAFWGLLILWLTTRPPRVRVRP